MENSIILTIYVASVSSVISFLISILTLRLKKKEINIGISQFNKKIKVEIKKFEKESEAKLIEIEMFSEQFQKQQTRILTEKLINKRLDIYPHVFSITDKLRSEYILKGSIDQNYILEIHQQLTNWHKSEGGYLLSKNSEDNYRILRDNLINSLDSFKSDTLKVELNKDEALKLRELKSNFRRCLRHDLDLIYTEDNQ
ncbi:MAG: hypothetical protein K8R44_06410 [Sulfurimonas sp.]|nr:hypothetical protein [Sulfurimonas sp.]